MSELGRIRRALNRAERELKELSSTRNVAKQQESWEQFLVAWRQGIELTRSFAESNDLHEICTNRHKERLGDLILDYAWEARNAEYHHSQGSMDLDPGFAIFNAVDPTKPLVIHSMHSKNGILSVVTSNTHAISSPAAIWLKPVARQKGIEVIEPPKDKTPHEICSYALGYASAYLDEVLKAVSKVSV